MGNKHELWELKAMQAAPLQEKIAMTKERIADWISRWGHAGIFVSFSGGKDSTVLLDIARQISPDMPAVFVDTGLEYPEIRDFVNWFDNLTVLRPKIHFKQVLMKYGYPLIGKEVAECVSGARKYVDSVIKGGAAVPLFLRQSDRAREISEKGEYP